MAYVLNQDDNNQDENKLKQLSGESGSISPNAGGAAPAAGGVGKGTSSGAFTNLQSYLKANSDQSPSTAISQKIGAQGQKATNQLSDYNNQFSGAVAGGSADVNKGLVDQAIAKPTDFVSNPDNIQAFQKQLNNSYAGPNSLTDLNGYNRSGQSAVSDELRQTKSEPGQFALLQRLVGRPQYSKGEQNLDQLLMKNSPQTKQDFSNLQSQYGGLGNQYDQAEKTSAGQAAARAADATAGNQYAHQQVQGGIDSTVNPIQQRLADYEKQRNEQYASNIAALKSNGQSGAIPEAFKNAGFDPSALTYGVDPASYTYIHQGQQANLSQAANADEYAKLNALSQLGGQQQSYIASPDQVGQMANMSPVTYDAGQLTGDIAKHKSAFTSDSAAAQAHINSLEQQLAALPHDGTPINQQQAGIQQELLAANQRLTDIYHQYGMPTLGSVGSGTRGDGTAGSLNRTPSKGRTPIGEVQPAPVQTPAPTWNQNWEDFFKNVPR